MDHPPFPLLGITSRATLERCRLGAPPLAGKSQASVIVCSYPKSGTTWLQNIVATLFSEDSKQGPLSHISDYTPFYEADSTWEKIDSGEHPVCRNHEALGVRMFNTHLYPSMVPEDAKVIYVMRRGKDVVHSFYQHLSHQIIDGKVDFEGSFEEFVQGWVEGSMPFGKWTDHLKVWREEERPGVLYLVYEEMKADLGHAVHQVAEFLELTLSYDDVEALVPRFTIDAMKADRKMFEPVSVQWEEGFQFVRKGEVGDSAQAFESVKMAQLFDSLVAEAWPEGVPVWAAPLVD